MKLSIGIATRGRPGLATWAAMSCVELARDAETKVVILADDDDMEIPKLGGVIVSREPREDSIGAKWNRLMRIAPADVYLAMCDRRAQNSAGYDVEILKAAEKFRDGIGVVNQHLANLSFPCYQAVTHKMASIMGGIYPEHFPYWFVDHWLDDIARMTGRFVYAEGATIEKPRPNGVTQEFREPAFWATLYDAQYIEREAIADRLLAQMAIADWQKDILRAQWPLIHQRSRILNDLVRGMKGDLPFDERYTRIRAAGAKTLHALYQQMKEAA